MTDNGWLADDPFVLNTVFLVVASSLAIALTSCLWNRIYSAHPPTLHPDPTCTSTPQQSPSVPLDQRDRKSTRTKERRRRGKDPFRDLLKGGKKSKALLKAIHDFAPPSADTLSSGSGHGNDTPSSASRSQSPEHTLDLDPLADGSHATVTDTSSTSAAALSCVPDHGAVSVHAHMDSIRPRSCPPSMASTDQTVMGYAREPCPSFPPVHTPQPCDTTGSSAGLARSQTRTRAPKIDAPVTSSSPVANPPLSLATCTRSGPSTPTNPRPSTPPDSYRDQLASMHDALEAGRLREEQLRLEAEQAAKERDQLCWRWNEDATGWRRREAELQVQIHHLVQQLRAYAAVASFQAQHAQNLPSSGFSSPTSPRAHSSPRPPFLLAPPMQAQDSASAPAHVQALLASAPMLASHPPAFAAPAPGGSVGMWPGMGLCVPNRDPRPGGHRTPDSSASGSSGGRRRRRRADIVKSASDDSSLGDWDGVEDGSEDDDPWEEDGEDDFLRNNPLADAILKRPESIRGLSAAARKRPGIGRGGVQAMAALKDPAAAQTHGLPPVDTSAVVQ